MANEEATSPLSEQVLEARQQLQKKLEEDQKQTAAEIASILHAEVVDILETSRKADHRLVYEPSKVVSPEKLLEAVRYALRDLDRLEVDQKQEFSITKYVGYLGFWFAKLKPLTNVQLRAEGVGTTSVEVLDVNEKVVFPLLRRLLLRMTRKAQEMVPALWRTCSNVKCAKAGDGKLGKCFFKKIDAFLVALGGRYHEYLFYTLRYRPASPYILVAVLDQAMHFSCETACPAAFT
jgi:hypothetical protein